MAEEEIICESEQKSQRSPCKWILVTTIFLIACGLFSALSIYNHLNINRLENDIIQAESRQDSFQIQEVMSINQATLLRHLYSFKEFVRRFWAFFDPPYSVKVCNYGLTPLPQTACLLNQCPLGLK